MNTQVNKIFETKNYNQFKKLKKNRDINQINIKASKERILKTRKTCVIPIIVNSKMEIIDGQHRLEACRQLEIPVRFYQTAEIREKDIPIIQGGRKWTLLDYVENHMKKEKESFVYLHNAYFQSGYNKLMGVGSFGVMFQGKSFTSAELANPDFELKSHMRKNFLKSSAKLNELLLIRPDFNSALRTEKWVKALCLLINHQTYNHDHLIQKIETTTKDPITSRKQAPVTDFLLDLYNQGLKEEEKIYSI